MAANLKEYNGKIFNPQVFDKYVEKSLKMLYNICVVFQLGDVYELY